MTNHKKAGQKRPLHVLHSDQQPRAEEHHEHAHNQVGDCQWPRKGPQKEGRHHKKGGKEEEGEGRPFGRHPLSKLGPEAKRAQGEGQQDEGDLQELLIWKIN